MVLDSQWTTRSDNLGPQSSDGAWSSFMNSFNIGGFDSGSPPGERSYSWTITFQNYGRQTFRHAVDDQGVLKINGVTQFSLGNYGGETYTSTPGYFSPGNYTITVTSVNSGGGPWGVAADWTGYVPPPPPVINSFSANPNPQLSSSGTPTYSTTLSWVTSNGVSATLTSSAGESWSVSVTGSRNITNLPQSTAGSNSPAQRNYTLTLVGQAATTSSTITVSAYNDNTPSGVSVDPNAISLGTPSGIYPLSSLESGVLYRATIEYSGVDMPVIISTSSDGTQISKDGTTWLNSFLMPTNQNTFYYRFTSLLYNTSTTPTGTNAAGEAIGSTNTKTLNFSVGSYAGSFNATTRAPVLEETFDSTGDSSYFPFPDIDVIPPEPTTEDYIFSDETLVDDIEVDVEIKTSNGNAQVQINNDGVWRDMREI